MENRAGIEEQLELFDSNTMEKLNPVKPASIQIIEPDQDPDAPYGHLSFPDLAPDKITSGHILLHWAYVYKEISPKKAAELLVQHLGDFLQLVSQDQAPEESINHSLALAMGDFVALQGCLSNLLPREKIDVAMWDILAGKKPTLC